MTWEAMIGSSLFIAFVLAFFWAAYQAGRDAGD
jgi:hypothetical protein